MCGVASAQGGGKPVKGDPTPARPARAAEPRRPSHADRLRPGAPGRNTSAVDENTPSNTRFILTGAETRNVVPARDGRLPAAASASGRAYRLEAIRKPVFGVRRRASRDFGRGQATAAGLRGQGTARVSRPSRSVRPEDRGGLFQEPHSVGFHSGHDRESVPFWTPAGIAPRLIQQIQAVTLDSPCTRRPRNVNESSHFSAERAALLACTFVYLVAAGLGLKAQAPAPPTQYLADQPLEDILGLIWGDPRRWFG